jgi:hypothetical protein
MNFDRRIPRGIGSFPGCNAASISDRNGFGDLVNRHTAAPPGAAGEKSVRLAVEHRAIGWVRSLLQGRRNLL